jgi:uncharacterized protein (TIGR03663 family)
MDRRPLRILALLLVLALAASLRLTALELRPPHHDEGVNGWFVEKMAKDGAYTYDPTNYHGPSYFYLLAASREAFGFGLWQLRLPGAIAGIALCFIPLLMRRRLGWTATIATCALLAASPTLVYYARYAIHETLLAGLGLLAAACMLRWADCSDGTGAGWLIGTAAAVAGMIATKETTIIFLGVAGLWLLAESIVESRRAGRATVLGHSLTWSRRTAVIAAVIVLVMAAIHVVFFTGFFQARGSLGEQLERSVRAYLVWTKTGTGETGHAKPWCYYLHLGARYELVLLTLATLGAVAGRRLRHVRAPALVGAGMLLVYSLVSYKMPWLPMSWLALLALPAGHGAIVAGRVLADEISARCAAGTAIVVALVPALVITARSSFVRPADKVESLAYVHTDPSYNEWFGLIEAGARRIGRDRLTIGVDLGWSWPLPWSLKPYPRTRWRASGNEDVMLVGVDRAAAVEQHLDRRYLRLQYTMRDSSRPAYLYLRRAVFADIVGPRISALTSHAPLRARHR